MIPAEERGDTSHETMPCRTLLLWRAAFALRVQALPRRKRTAAHSLWTFSIPANPTASSYAWTAVTVVNDAADEDDFDSICAALERRGVQRIDYLILSHYDKDHIGSAAALVRAYPVGQILGPDYEEDSMYLTLLKRAAEERNTPFRRLTENYTVETANGSFTLDPPDIDYGDDNNNSLVTTVTWRETSFLLLGDAKKNAERVSRRRARQL